MTNISNQTIAWIDTAADFPNTSQALTAPNGLLAASTEINAQWLMSSYSKGIFPWYSRGEPVLWWTPSPRAVLYTKQFKLHRSLRKVIQKQANDPAHQLCLNTDFEGVMRNCAQQRQGQEGTWITEEIIQAYCELHQLGFAHSIEHWQNNQLIGGLYCVAIGHMVYGESMFSRQTDASKVAFACFVSWLKAQNVHMIDCQQATRHLMSLGACTVSRLVFETEMTDAMTQPPLNWESQQLIWKNDYT